MDEKTHFEKFLKAQEEDYDLALGEVRTGLKQHHWIWYIFPTLLDLAQSSTAKEYGIRDLQEARDYLRHPILGKRLLEITQALLDVEDIPLCVIFSLEDRFKIQASMTLFHYADSENPLFTKVLIKYCYGEEEEQTLRALCASPEKE